MLWANLNISDPPGRIRFDRFRPRLGPKPKFKPKTRPKPRSKTRSKHKPKAWA